jgi:class 3 adenylate cyclase/pimeloyl-ACP methyl ester carboxylesterase
MAREIRYCTSRDGTRIAYADSGEGEALVFCPGFVESFALDHLYPAQDEFLKVLAAGRRLIRYDRRGTGSSQRRVDDVSFECACEDLEAVVDAAGLDCFSLMATAVSVSVAIAYAASHPDRLHKLVLASALLGGPERSAGEVESILRSYAALARANWPLAAQILADTQNQRLLAPERAIAEAALYVASADGEIVARMLEAWPEAVVEPILPDVRTPTLIIRGIDNDPDSVSEHIASILPNARLLSVTGNASYELQGAGLEILDAIVSFLDGERAVTAQQLTDTRVSGGFRTILFTDIVGHTAMMQRLGDARGRDVLREHERITRETLRAHGGAEVKTMGDGFMASFASVAAAVECAIALQRGFAEPLAGGETVQIRVGLNAGEPIEEDGDLFGAMVILASRVCARADAGEILIPEPVRHLLAGKSYVYADRGETMLKGFEDAVRLYEVRWQ